MTNETKEVQTNRSAEIRAKGLRYFIFEGIRGSVDVDDFVIFGSIGFQRSAASAELGKAIDDAKTVVQMTLR